MPAPHPGRLPATPRRWLFTALCALTLAAAPADAGRRDDDRGGDGDGDRDHHHRGGVELQPHTRVLSPALRAALRAFDPASGTLRFAGDRRLLGDLAVGQVLVSEPSRAAPFGLLRRVTAVRHGRGEVQLTTVPARLDEALRNAHATFSLLLDTGASRTATRVPLAAPVAGLGTSTSLDLEYHQDGIDLSVHGHETASVGVTVGVDIDAACFFDGDPCFGFTAQAGMLDDAAITIDGRFDTSFSKSFPLFSKDFDPIVFFIGPVPVVLVPKLDIEFNLDGTAKGTFSFAGAANGPEHRMSVHWDSDHGFSSGLDSRPASMQAGPINLVADVDLHARLPTRMQLLLYDAAGVNAVVTAGLDAHLHIPGRPRWTLDGLFQGEVGVNATLPLIGDLGSTEVTLFDERFHLGESVNAPPRVAVLLPVPGQQVTFGWPDFGHVNLLAHASDDEDGDPCCAIAWFLASGAPLATGNDLFPQLPTPGHFEVVARATDRDGATTSSAPVGVDAVLPPPGAGIALPGAACESRVYTGVPVRLLGQDGYFSNQPYTCVWLSDNPADAPQFSPAEEIAGSFDPLRGCELETFFPTTGVRTLQLDVFPVVNGVLGPPSSAFKTLRVADPPPGSVPRLRRPGPAACETVGLDVVQGTLHVWLEAPGLGTTVDFRWQPTGCAAVPIPAHRAPPSQCVPGYCPADFQLQGAEVLAATPAGCGGRTAAGVVTVTATDAQGQPNSTLFYVDLFDQTVH